MNSAFGSFGIIIVIVIVVAIFLIPQIFYLLTLHRTLDLCAPHNRKIPPGQVWLILIPLFGIVWHFLVVGYVADSLAAEFQQRNIHADENRPGYNIGRTFLILQICGIVPFLGILSSVAGLVCWIIYWVKIAGYKTMLENSNAGYGIAPPRI